MTVIAMTTVARAEETVASPDGKIRLSFDVVAGKPTYSVDYCNAPIIKPSHLGVQLAKGGEDLMDGFSQTDVECTSFDETWTPVWGEESSIRNHYNELAITLNQKKTDRHIILRFRVYDDGVGFRYEFPRQKNLVYFTLREEKTEFAMAGYLATLTHRNIHIQSHVFQRYVRSCQA